MVKAKTKPLNLLIPEELSEWFTDHAKSLGKTKTEIICTFLQGIKNGEAYSDVENHVGNDVDSIESVVKAYLDEHLQDYVEKYLHDRKPTDVESYVDNDVENPVGSDIESDKDNHVDGSESLIIIEAIETIAAPSIENPSNDEVLSNAIAATLKTKDHFSFNEMLTVLGIKKNEKGGIGAQNQTQFEYVKQRIFEETGQTWKWEGAPKDGKWVKVDDATIASLSIEKSLNGKGLSDTIAATKQQITYNLNHDGSVILRSLRGITDKQLKRMSDDELKAIGLFKTLRGKNEKFFPNDETLELRYQEKSKPSAKPKSTKRSAKSKAILTRPEALVIAQRFGFNGTGQNIYDWAKSALTAKSEESKLSNREKLAAVGLVAVFTPENKPAWKAKTR